MYRMVTIVSNTLVHLKFAKKVILSILTTYIKNSNYVR